jgi:tRNA-specific 2-thiouridylase
MKKKVLLGMSGGVDSSAAAIILLDQGYEVTGVTMKLRPDRFMEDSPAGGCCSLDDIEDARRVAYRLGIEHLVMNFTEVFSKNVIAYFAREYEAGRTPNPCIACNRYVKFDALLRRARILGFDYIATGHYARISRSADSGRWQLQKALSAKDQSYVLYHLTQDQLASTLFPLGLMEKSDARALAAKHSLDVASKPDSQEICFVPDGNYAVFLERYTGKVPLPGNFLDQTGGIIGRHRGITHYTIGQRKGLGISFGKPMYVTKIDAAQNTVTLGEEGAQYAASLIARDVNWIPFPCLNQEIKAFTKVRYQSHPTPATLTPMQDGRVSVVFDIPQRSVTPGQSVVFYHDDLVLGGGIIE